MSIPQDQVPNTVHTGNGVSTEFSYEFYAPDLADVYVAIDGVRVTSGWTAVRDSDETGRVIFETAPADGTKVTIYRSTPITQEETWSNGQAFYPGTVGSALDKLTMVAQELRGGVVNIPGTVVTADSANHANYASSAGSATRATYVTNVSSATRAGSASSAGYASSAGSAGYFGPFRAYKDGFTTGTDYVRILGGYASILGSSYPVGSGRLTFSTGETATIYLTGTSGAGGFTFSHTKTEPSAADGTFYARIASFEAGTVKQLQFGDIVTVPFGGGGGGGGNADYASSAGIASGLTDAAATAVVDSAVSSAVTSAESAVLTKTDFSTSNRTSIVIGSSNVQSTLRYYTTSASAHGAYTKLGNRLGGVLAGTLIAPDEATDTWDINITIGDSSGASSFYLLHPKQEYVMSGGSALGVLYTPRVAHVFIQIAPDTDFHVYLAATSGGIGDSYLHFYPNVKCN